MAKFKTGDVVRVSSNAETREEIVGKTGKVLEVDLVPWIDFGFNVHDYPDSYSFNKVPSPKPPLAQCWPVDEDYLELVARPVEPEHETAADEALGLVSVHMRIPVELHEALKAIAEGKGWVLPAVLREALSLYAYK